MLLATVYVTLQHRQHIGIVFLKPLPIFLLAFWVQQSNGDMWLLFALLLSAAGDIALGLDSERYFVQGLGFFLIAHWVYVIVFSRQMGFAPQAFVPIIIVLVFASILIPRLLPALGKLRIPVLLYISSIVLMGITAALYTPFSFWLSLGAIVFMASDAIIAINKFIQPVSYRDFAVMVTYYLAQYLVVASLLI